MPPETYLRRDEFSTVYLFDIYIAVAMLLGETVGTPAANGQIVIAVTAMLVGALVLAALFGNVAMLVANFNLSTTRLQEKMDQVSPSVFINGFG